MDIDRTPELLAWVFGELFSKKRERSEQQPASEQPGVSGRVAGVADPAPHRDLTASAAGPTGTATIGKGTESCSPAPAGGNTSVARTEVATVGGGCFWCIEACFSELQGVISVTSGYAGGHVPNPTYQQVCSKTTGHAEVVQVVYDPDLLSYKDILQVFMSIHDPTTPNRQGNDVGPQYRSIILHHSEEQRVVAEQVLAEAGRGGWFARRVCTELAPLQAFYKAESVHQRYYARNPNAGYCTFVVSPKLQEFRRKYAKRLKSQADVTAL